ncbi:MerR family DNA-binding transcriptional regulator [Sphingobium sp. GW456-12-10-14-TSB1]|uniref:MerR family DNA-binding transcriptional regulator n=1 Tax=Sphingobium sp. GW456-12-10-14-TSB1 TaxID=1987165 RepID=UPI00267CF984
MTAITIGRLSTATGVKIETIRYYERAGLIDPPARTEGNYRSYGADDVWPGLDSSVGPGTWASAWRRSGRCWTSLGSGIGTAAR